MKIITNLQDLPNHGSKATIALGTFDGIHIGHQKIISRAVDIAKQENTISMVFTFSNHPLSMVDPERCPPQLATQEQKAELIENLGVDILLTIPFTPEFLHLSAMQFIKLLIEKVNPNHIVIGPNFFFGYKRSGTPELLYQSGLQRGFHVEIHPTVYVNERIVSSTVIRQMIKAGHIDQAAQLLGRPVQIRGIVVHGAKRGRELGFPTINLDFASELVLPADGVYVVTVTIEQIQYHGIANVGNNPTFNGLHRHLEVHILNFTGNLYGQSVTVQFLKHLRGQFTFSSAEELKLQIAQDIEVAKRYYLI